MNSMFFPRMSVRTVRVYGQLGARFGRKFRLAVQSPAEAIHALCQLVQGFERELMESKDKGVGYAVFVGKRNIAKEELRNLSGWEDIRIAPIIMGSKKGGIFQIILGAVLVVVGGSAWILSMGASTAFSAALVSMGWAMIIGGVVQLLTPTPRGNASKDRPENTPSYSFNGSVNTQAQGNPVPLLYGELIIGSAVISAGISAEDQVYVPTTVSTTTGANGSSGGGGSPPWHNEWVAQQ